MVEPEDYGESLGDYGHLKDKQRGGKKVFAKSELVRTGKTPRGIQERVLYVAQALAALVTVTFGRVFSGELWDQKPVRKRLQKL